MLRCHATIEEALGDSDHPATEYETWLARRAAESSIAPDEWFVGEVDGEWAKGRETAGLGVDLANPTQAARLYRAVGMHPLYEANIYQRMVQTSGDAVRVGR